MDNPLFPFYKIFQNVDWSLSDGSKIITTISATLIATYGIDTVIEIGLLKGFSSLLLGRALECSAGSSGLLLSCDISPVYCENAKAQTKDLSITHQIVCKDSMDLDLIYLLQNRKVGLAFIDGKHKYDWCKSDIEKCHKVIKPGGFLVVHDDWIINDVRKPLVEFISREEWKYFKVPSGLPPGDSSGVILQKKE